MIRVLLLFLMIIPVLSEAKEIPRQYGKFHLGMRTFEVAIITGIPGEDFDGTCASCSEGTNEVSVAPKFFSYFSDVFPGLVVDTWMPNAAVILMTTKNKVTGFVIHYDEKVKDPLTIISRRLGKPRVIKRSGGVTYRWKDSRTTIEHDHNTIRIYDRRYNPSM
jgi:hypothetical protein